LVLVVCLYILEKGLLLLTCVISLVNINSYFIEFY
jgi:hypothetical protein